MSKVRLVGDGKRKSVNWIFFMLGKDDVDSLARPGVPGRLFENEVRPRWMIFEAKSSKSSVPVSSPPKDERMNHARVRAPVISPSFKRIFWTPGRFFTEPWVRERICLSASEISAIANSPRPSRKNS